MFGPEWGPTVEGVIAPPTTPTVRAEANPSGGGVTMARAATNAARGADAVDDPLDAPTAWMPPIVNALAVEVLEASPSACEAVALTPAAMAKPTPVAARGWTALERATAVTAPADEPLLAAVA